MTPLRHCLFLTWSLGSLFGCSEADPEPEIFTAVTYNAGLATGYVEAADQRAPKTTSQVVALDADLLCVQEYWNDDHLAQLKAAAGNDYQGVQVLDPQPGDTGSAACEAGDVDEVYACAESNCSNLCTDELTNCVLVNCGGELAQLNKDHMGCYGCLVSNVGKELSLIKATCESQSTQYAYGGSFGIALLTKKTPISTSSKVFASALNRRAVVHSRVPGDNGDPIDVFCTHLTSALSDVPHPTSTDADAWEQEQAAQIDELLAFIVQTAGGTDNVVLMGDLNTGPKGVNYVAEIADHYQKFVDAGLINPYTANADADCTFCSSNPLNKDSGNNSSSSVIDHIFFGGLDDIRDTRRVLDGTIKVESCGQEITTGYSDHYGVSVSFAH